MKKITNEKKRNLIQLAAAVLINGYVVGFRKGTIFTGKSKAVCVPVLNCYSCPGALGPVPSALCSRFLAAIIQGFPFMCWVR